MLFLSKKTIWVDARLFKPAIVWYLLLIPVSFLNSWLCLAFLSLTVLRLVVFAIVLLVEPEAIEPPTKTNQHHPDPQEGNLQVSSGEV